MFAAWSSKRSMATARLVYQGVAHQRNQELPMVNSNLTNGTKNTQLMLLFGEFFYVA